MRPQNKVLYVASTFGHLASFHQPYMQWFAQQGYEVHAAAGGEPCELAGTKRYIQLPFEKSMFSYRNFRAAKDINRLIQAEQYQMISLHTSLAAYFARLAVCPLGKQRPVVVNTVHGYLFDEKTPVLKRMLLLGAEKMTAPVTDWLLTMNCQDDMIARQNGLGENIIGTKGMGIPLERFTRPMSQEKNEARASLGIKPAEIAMVFAAEFSKRKNQEMLIKAMSDLPENFILLLPGRGDMQKECVQLAIQLGVAGRIRFPGFVQDMKRYYHAADICVTSSRIEGLPFNVMEAMACGLPVIATRIKGHIDLIDQGENGFLYPFDDQQAFINAARSLLDAEKREKMGENAQKRVQPYGMATVFPELTAIYTKAMNKN